MVPGEAEICAYCGIRAATERDHVPPKTLFPTPRPSNLVTVPVCGPCHEPTSLDDEFFRNILVMEKKTEDHPVADQVLDDALRGIQRPKSAGLRASLLISLTEVERRSPTGLYLGRETTFKFGRARVDGVVSRIVSGLFYHHSRERLAPTHTVTSLYEGGIQGEAPESLRTALAALSQSEPYDIGERVFSYRKVAIEEDRKCSVWLLEFYESMRWLAVTMPARTDTQQLDPIKP